MDLYDAMRTTTATRFFSEKPVGDDVIFRVLDAARFASSGGNRQGWRVVVVRDDTLRRGIRDIYLEPWRLYVADREPAARSETAKRLLAAADHMAENLDKVPVHLVVCVELAALSLTDAGLDRPSIVGGGSIYPFVQNLLLACRNEGLGSALTTLVCVREPELRGLLDIPAEFAVAALIPVGYPAKPFPNNLSRREVGEIATLDTFGGEPFSSDGSVRKQQ